MKINITPVDKIFTIKVICPTGHILSIPAECMPGGWTTWDRQIEEIAREAARKIGLRVTVEQKEICTADPEPLDED